MPSEKIRRAAEILSKVYKENGDEENIIAAKDEVLERYGPKFDPEVVGNLTWDDFLGFLDFNNNKHWSHIDIYARRNPSLRERFESDVRPALANLMDDRQEIADRVDRSFQVKGLDKATVTPFLLVEFPQKYGVWNAVSEWTLKTLGIWLDTYAPKSTVRLSGGATYKFANDTLVELAREMKVDLWTLDAVLYYYRKSHTGEICIDLIEGKKYSRKNLCDIFSPEYKFSSQNGIWGMTGVNPINLGAREDRALFVVSERSSGRAIPEVLLDDGTFDWITQRRITEGESALVKKLKNEHDKESRILLFMKQTESGDEYTYCGPLQYLREYKDETGERRFVYSLDSWQNLERLIGRDSFPNALPDNPTGKARLDEVDPPAHFGQSDHVSSSSSHIRNSRRYFHNDEENKKLGDEGEQLVETYEKEKLSGTGLESRVKRISILDDTAGYDIRSFERTGEEIWIEVKTTRAGLSRQFYISSNEYEVSKEKSSKYRLYRLFNYNRATGAKFYVIKGSMERLSPRPATYIVDVVPRER